MVIGLGANDFMGGLFRAVAKDKKRKVKKIGKDATKEFKKKGKQWSNTAEGKLITGVVGGYMRNRGKINKALKDFNFAVE